MLAATRRLRSGARSGLDLTSNRVFHPSARDSHRPVVAQRITGNQQIARTTLGRIAAISDATRSLAPLPGCFLALLIFPAVALALTAG